LATLGLNNLPRNSLKARRSGLN